MLIEVLSYTKINVSIMNVQIAQIVETTIIATMISVKTINYVLMSLDVLIMRKKEENVRTMIVWT